MAILFYIPTILIICVIFLTLNLITIKLFQNSNFLFFWKLNLNPSVALTEASFNGGSLTNSLFSDSLILELLCRLSPFFSVMPSTFNFFEIFVTGGVSDSGFFLPSILNDMRKQNNRKCHFFSIRHSVLNFNCVTFICTDILSSPVILNSLLIGLLSCLKENQMCLHYHFHIYNHV